MQARTAGTLETFARDKQKWYDADAGASVVRELVATAPQPRTARRARGCE